MSPLQQLSAFARPLAGALSRRHLARHRVCPWHGARGQVRAKSSNGTSTTSSTAPQPRGALIVFEGVDRCGKSTQSKLLVEHLQSAGVPVQHWVFPDRTTSIGTTINAYLKDSTAMDAAAIHLLFVANRFEKRSELLSLLSRGTTLVVDRYSYSGVAYTAAKGVPHLGADYCRAVEVGLPAPDVVVYLRLDPRVSAARGGYGTERYEKVEFQQKVAAQFEALVDDRWLVLDAEEPTEQLHRQVVAGVTDSLDRARQGAPLGRLWDLQPIPLPPAPAAVAVQGAQAGAAAS